MNRIDLENRLLAFAHNIHQTFAPKLNHASVRHLANQILRSSSSVLLNNAEREFASSKKDFYHKSRLVLKELNETRVCLRLFHAIEEVQNSSLEALQCESKQLVAIFASTCKKLNTQMDMINKKRG